MADDNLNLTGHVLIAMPGMSDPRFAHSVVYLCDHSEKGAMGLIVNKPASEINFDDLLEQLEIAPEPGMRPINVHFGGPVETGRGFVLHSSDYASDLRTLTVQDGVALTPTLDVLEDIARGAGPRDAMMLLGYAGWGPGQLENEIANNGWLTCPGARELVFDIHNDAKWSAALERLGIDPALLSGDAGTA